MTPLKDLRARYGGSDSRAALNRAIRVECPGGDVALDRLESWHHICERFGWSGTPEPLQVTAYRHLLEIVEVMEEEVRRRHGMPPRGPRGDLRR